MTKTYETMSGSTSPDKRASETATGEEPAAKKAKLSGLFPLVIEHVEMPAADMARARAFYAAAFDWTSGDFTADGSESPMTDWAWWKCPVSRGSVCGGFTLKPDYVGKGEVVPTIEAPDAAAAVERILAAGGTLVTKTVEIGEYRSETIVADTEGNKIKLWTAKMGPSGTHGSLNHVSFPVADVAKSREFFSNLFGWSFTPMKIPGKDADYNMFELPVASTTPEGEAERKPFHGGMAATAEPIAPGPGVVATFSATAACPPNTVLTAVEAAGGKILDLPESMAGGATFARFADLDGNVWGIYGDASIAKAEATDESAAAK